MRNLVYSATWRVRRGDITEEVGAVGRTLVGDLILLSEMTILGQNLPGSHEHSPSKIRQCH